MSPEPRVRAGAELKLAIDGARIDVAADHAADLDWLAEFLAPAFDVDAPGPGRADHHVRLTISAAGYARLRDALGRAPRAEIEGLGFDGRFSRHACTTDERGRTWAHDERWELFLGVDDGARRVDVVAKRRDAHARLGLMRVVRELATAAFGRRGRLPVHGAAFEMDGRAVLLCGPKRSGKTSLLVHALQRGGAFLSNDRLFVETHGAPFARAMPTVVTLRDGTLALHPGLASTLADHAFDRGLTIAECAGADRLPGTDAPAGSRLRCITPAQFCHAAGVPMRRRAPVGLLLFPRVDPGLDGIVIEPLDASAAHALMTASLMKPSHPTRYSPLFAPDLADAPVDPVAESQRCRRLVEAVPARACRLGPDAYRGDLLDVLRRQDTVAREHA
ncbi:MAG: phosphoenolpyruvate carboxykinase (ATP) [Planctomycetota bacterium]|jgi:hypothetical protein